MSRPRNGGSRFKGLAVSAGSGSRGLAARGVQPAFDGTIASARELMGISLEKFIEMMRWAKESDPRVARFFDVWDALGASEQQARGTADAVREQVGLRPLELLGIVRDAACRASMYEAQIIAVATHPRVVEKTVDMALNDPNSRVRLAAQTVLHKATGFLPTPKGSQTAIAITQNAQTNATARAVAAPSPEETIRRLANRFNEARGLPPPPAAALPGTAGSDTLPTRVLHKDTEPAPFEVPEEEEDDGK